MKHTTRHSAFAPIAAAAAGIALAIPAHAALVWNDIQIGGFVSQGYLYNTGDNDYLGDTSEGTFDFREYAVNASYATGKFRFGAQGFAQKLGEYGDDKISLDWASVDYQHARWLGLRAGRVKTPRGLYNEALDVDSIRPFVLLPQSVYDARLRDFNASFDGAMLYGNVGMGELGSFDYKLYYGDIPMQLDSGANDFFNQDIAYPNTRIGMDSATGGTVFYNTPFSGLRIGYSQSVYEEFGMDRAVEFFPGFAFNLSKITPEYGRRLLSAEYVTGDWVFALEGGKDQADYEIAFVDFPEFPSFSSLDFQLVYAYASAARRLNEKFEVGSYVSYSKETTDIITEGVSAPFSKLEQTDYALSLRYDFNYNWLMKAEVHYMDGSGKIFTTPSEPQPLETRDDSWVLFALKSTYSF